MLTGLRVDKMIEEIVTTFMQTIIANCKTELTNTVIIEEGKLLVRK
jgi:hypothetical protein